ncbi:MAG: zinc metalloprotease HtpX [Gemmatimonadales bacterium]|jgi:heat shock protein HtpX
MGNMLKTTMLLATMSALLLAIGQIAGGQQGLVIALAIAALFNFGTYWFADKVVLAMYRAQPVDEGHRLHRVVARLADRSGLPMPRVYVIPTASPNAFATGRNPQHAAVAATEGILQLLDDQELSGVMAHELAHVKHRDILISSIAATIGAAIVFLPRFALFFGDRDRGNPFALLGMVILAPIAAMLIQAAISRSREFAADRGGADIAGAPDGLAKALAKLEAGVRQRPLPANPATQHMFIVKPLSGRGVVSLFSTHPPTEERIERLLG